MKENSITLPGRLILILPEGSSFPGGASGKEPACQCRRRKTWVWPEWGRSPWRDGIATHSSILAWRIPWTEKPGRLQSTGSQSQTCLKRLCVQHEGKRLALKDPLPILGTERVSLTPSSDSIPPLCHEWCHPKTLETVWFLLIGLTDSELINCNVWSYPRSTGNYSWRAEAI